MVQPTPRWGGLTVDCRDPEALASFWAALLGTKIRGRWEQYVNLEPAPGAPVLAFQQVPSTSDGKNALHLDLHARDDAEVEQVVDRAAALGAVVHARVQQDDISWVVMLDPEGNQFCVVAYG